MFVWFIDGALDKTDSTTLKASDFPATIGLPCSVGKLKDSGGSFAKGLIDELNIWNRALSASDVQSLYASGSPVSCFHRSDANQDGCISLTELTVFIDRWKVNNLDVTLRELIEAIGLWKLGC